MPSTGNLTCTQGTRHSSPSVQPGIHVAVLAPTRLEKSPTSCEMPLSSMAKSSPPSVLELLEPVVGCRRAPTGATPHLQDFSLTTHKTTSQHWIHPFIEGISVVFTANSHDSKCFISASAHCSKSAGESEVSSTPSIEQFH